MSIIVAVKKNKKIAIACDSNQAMGTLNIKAKYLNGRSKIIEFRDGYLGTVGATAHHHVLSDLLSRYKSKLSFKDESSIFKSYLFMHDILTEEYYLNTSEGEGGEEYQSSQIEGLIINPKGIFGIYSWREVYEFDRFWAIGSGRNYALGSLYSMYDKESDAETIAEIAVRSACEFDDGCEEPVIMKTLNSNTRSKTLRS